LRGKKRKGKGALSARKSVKKKAGSRWLSIERGEVGRKRNASISSLLEREIKRGGKRGGRYNPPELLAFK